MPGTGSVREKEKEKQKWEVKVRAESRLGKEMNWAEPKTKTRHRQYGTAEKLGLDSREGVKDQDSEVREIQMEDRRRWR